MKGEPSAKTQNRFPAQAEDPAKHHGDAPLNHDGIREQELLVVSFGTSFNGSRALDIRSIEIALEQAFPHWSVRRAFSSQTIINRLLARDGIRIDNVEEALERAAANGVKHLVVQPTHLMQGIEYDLLVDAVASYRDRFQSAVVAQPLLGDADTMNADKEAVAKAVVNAAMREAGFGSAKEAHDASTAAVLMGHGTSHTAKNSYSQMQRQMDRLGYQNVFVGTVEGDPEETECHAILASVIQAGYRNVIMRPLMVVAGDHANNDMAGDDEESWKSIFLASGKIDGVRCQIAGLGQIPEIQEVYVSHTAAAIEEI